MTTHYDAIILGLGAMGSATAWRLAQRGLRIFGLEQFDIPNTLGSSHGLSRLIRLAYYEHPDYVPLLRRAYELWHQLEHASGKNLLTQTGGIYIGREDSSLIAGSLRSARDHGLDHQLLSHAEMANRFPQFSLDKDMLGFHEPAAGFLHPEACITAFIEQALHHGATIHAREPVTHWQSDGTHITVQTPRATYTAQRLIICGGPWAGQLLQDLQLPLRVTRQVIGWVWPKSPDLFQLGRFTIWALQDNDNVYYGTPINGDAPGLKLALHRPATDTNPDHVNRNLLPGDEATFRGIIKHMPLADGPLLASRVCLYTNTPDGHFILDQHPAHKNVHFAAGFSGHGFKFASVVGEVMANLTMHHSTALPVTFMSLERFAKARPS